MDDPDITMEDYVHYETEKSLRNGQVYNWETAKYGKISWLSTTWHFNHHQRTLRSPSKPGHAKYCTINQQLRRKGKWVVGADATLRKVKVIQFHTSAIRGHSGVHITLKRIESFFYWKRMRRFVKEIARTCDEFTHPYTAKTIAWFFLDHIYKLHGLLKSIINDRDKRCMTGERPKDWTLLFPLVEYWYNTNYYSATKNTSFEIVYGQPPSLHIPYIAKDCRFKLVDMTLQAREKEIGMLRYNLKKAQDRMKSKQIRKEVISETEETTPNKVEDKDVNIGVNPSLEIVRGKGIKRKRCKTDEFIHIYSSSSDTLNNTINAIRNEMNINLSKMANDQKRKLQCEINLMKRVQKEIDALPRITFEEAFEVTDDIGKCSFKHELLFGYD
nr:hypothetical protein [Tanacetum cinerariifolium]